MTRYGMTAAGARAAAGSDVLSFMAFHPSFGREIALGPRPLQRTFCWFVVASTRWRARAPEPVARPPPNLRLRQVLQARQPIVGVIGLVARQVAPQLHAVDVLQAPGVLLEPRLR